MPRPIPPSETPQRVTRSQIRVAASDDAALDEVGSPPCDTDLLRDLNSGIELPDHNSVDGDDNRACPNPTNDEILESLEEDDVSISSDETWTPSVHGEDSDDGIQASNHERNSW